MPNFGKCGRFQTVNIVVIDPIPFGKYEIKVYRCGITRSKEIKIFGLKSGILVNDLSGHIRFVKEFGKPTWLTQTLESIDFPFKEYPIDMIKVFPRRGKKIGLRRSVSSDSALGFSCLKIGLDPSQADRTSFLSDFPTVVFPVATCSEEILEEFYQKARENGGEILDLKILPPYDFMEPPENKSVHPVFFSAKSLPPLSYLGDVFLV